MEGTIIDIIRTYQGKFRVTFEVDSADELNGISGMIKIIVKKVNYKRSLTANAYFHVLVGKIADELGIPKATVKNILLGKYGQREVYDSGPLIITVRSDIDMLNREDLHCVAAGYGTIKGKDYTHWAVIRGSHTYDTKEMSALIDGSVSDAKELGIETLSPAEIERMKALWNSNQ